MSSVSFLKDPKGWTIDVLFGEMRKIHDAAQAEKARISMNNQHVIELGRQADMIQDPAKRAAAKATVDKLYKNQVSIATQFKQFGAAWAKGVGLVRTFMNAVGIEMPQGLGVLPLVPIAIAAAVIVAGVIVAAVVSRNNAASKEIAAKAQVLAQLASGNVTPDEAKALMAEIDKSNPPPSDPLGLTDALKAATPVLLLIGAIMILPPIVESFTRSRARTNPRRRRRSHRRRQLSHA